MSNEQNDQEEYRGGEDQPWREARNEPEPLSIEGEHDGREIAKAKQRSTMPDSGVGDASHPDGATGGGDEGYYGDESSGSSYGVSGGTETGSSITPHGSQSHKHAHGRGRDTEGAFGQEESQENANPLNDIADAGISKREIGASGTGEQTQGGHS